MNEHVLELLEFSKVRRMLASRASSAMGCQSALALSPAEDLAVIDHELDLVRQMQELMLAGLEPGPMEVGDLAALLPRLRREGEWFEPPELLELGKFLSISTRVHERLDRREVAERCADLHRLGQRFGDFHRIVRRLDEVFDPTGELLDTASPRLARIRRRLRGSRLEASAILEKQARDGSGRPGDTFVTLRDGRYVLAVRSQDRGRLGGIVHGHSKTGQTVFLEPLDAVDRNNAISTLEAEEQQERSAILRELAASIQERHEEIAASYEAAAEYDLIRAKARLGLDLDGRIPSFNRQGLLRLVAARHPILAEAAKRSAGRVVPLDLDLTAEARTLVLSGPNMGGKTVALKTVGLLCMMAQSGLPVPAGEGTDLPLLDRLFVDLGDEQSIEQETSTFAGHLHNVAAAFGGASSSSLVLLDELGGGTDPEEGTALGRALIELLTERGCLVIVTTHLVGLKLVAHENPRMRNAAMEFDPSTRKPTYRLRVGAPGRSRAFELAREILPAGELIERAEAYRSRLSAGLDELLGQLEARRAVLDEEIRSLRGKREELEVAARRKVEQAERLRERLQRLRESRWETAGQTIAEAEKLLAEARRIREEAGSQEAGKRPAEACGPYRQLQEEIASLQARMRRPPDPLHAPYDPHELHAGTSAWSHDLKSLVRIDSEPEGGDRVWILHRSIRFLVPIDSLGHPHGGGKAVPRRPGRVQRKPSPHEEPVARELDIRGLRAEEGVERTERLVDRAALAGVPEVRIIHGKGTGTLKREIEAFLRSSPLVESFRTGEPREGGWGATIVRVRSAQVEG